jgi:ABC-type transport system involved in multi-copper enzyme maturation permease subunit
VGPLFYFELVRLARQGRNTLLRCAYAAVLLVDLYLAYRTRFPQHDLWKTPFASPANLPAGLLTVLAQRFVLAILWVQTAAVFVLTPVYVAGAVAEEKERHTLEMLFTTHLTGREIIFGKLAARVTHLGGILLAGLPLLALTQLWGGVDLFILLAAYAMTGLNLLSVGSLSMLISVFPRTTWKATTSAYAASAVQFIVCLAFPCATPASLFETMYGYGDHLWTASEFLVSLLLCAACLAVFALACSALAAFYLRPVAVSQANEPVRRKERTKYPVAGWLDPFHLTHPARRRIAPPPVRDRPLLWKETTRSGWSEFAREFEYGLRDNWRVALVLAVFILACMGVICYSPGWEWRVSIVASLMRTVLVCAAVAWCLGTALRAAGSVSLERDRRTLDGLMSLPVRREAVLGAKWLGSILRGRDLGYVLAVVGTIGLANGMLHPAALFLVAVAVAAQVGFWASLGLWLSVTCRNTLRSRVTMAVLLLAFAGSLLYGVERRVLGRRGSEPLSVASLRVGANPVRAWWILAYGWRGADVPERVSERLFGVRLAAVGGSLAFALVALVLWEDTCLRFRKQESG